MGGIGSQVMTPLSRRLSPKKAKSDRDYEIKKSISIQRQLAIIHGREPSAELEQPGFKALLRRQQESHSHHINRMRGNLP
jgi:hypothetical protein